MRGAAPDRLVALGFWGLGVLCLLNLNALVRMWIGVDRAFSGLMLLCCLLTLAGLLRVRPREALGAPGALILGCLASYLGIGSLVAIVNGTALQSQATWHLVRYAGAVLVILAAAVGGHVVWRRIGGERLLLGTLVILTASCMMMLASPWLFDVLQDPPSEGIYRFFGSYADPNEAGTVASFTVVLALALMRLGRHRLVGYGALAVAAVAVVGTFSRTALVVIPVLVFGALLVSHREERRRVASGALVVALVGAGVAVTLNTNLFEERQIARLYSMVDVFDPAGRDLSLAGRTTLWQLALDQTLESPLFGNGLGRLHELDGAWYNERGVLLGAHNHYLVLWGEAGFVPLILFVAFLATAFLAGFRQQKAYWALGAVSGWALVLMMFTMTFHSILTLRATNFVIGLSCAVIASLSAERSGAPGSDSGGTGTAASPAWTPRE